MKTRNNKILQVILLSSLIMGFSLSTVRTTEKSKYIEIEKIFNTFESGVKSKSIKEFSGYLMSEVYISLEDGTASYFSASQSYHILSDYFNQFNHMTFKFIKKEINIEKPFAVGQIKHNKNGVRGSSQIFITLQQENGVWKISQIIIN